MRLAEGTHALDEAREVREHGPENVLQPLVFKPSAEGFQKAARQAPGAGDGLESAGARHGVEELQRPAALKRGGLREHARHRGVEQQAGVRDAVLETLPQARVYAAQLRPGRVFRDSASHLANDARSHGKGAVSGSDRHRGGSASVVKDSLAISARSSNGSVTRNGGSAPSVTSSIASDSKYNRSPPAAPSAPGSVSVTRNTRWITSASFDSVELIAAKTPPPRQGTPGEDTAECGEI